MTTVLTPRSAPLSDGIPFTSGFGINDTLRDVHGPDQVDQYLFAV